MKLQIHHKSIKISLFETDLKIVSVDRSTLSYNSKLRPPEVHNTSINNFNSNYQWQYESVSKSILVSILPKF